MATSTFVARTADGLVLAETQEEARDVGRRLSPSCKRQATQLLSKLHSMPPRCSLFDNIGGHTVFHLMICDGVCYLGLFNRNYPSKLAFSYLDEIRLVFLEELKRTFGTGSVDHRSHIDTIDRPYFFAGFDRQILKKKAEYQDPSSSLCLSRLHTLSTNPPWRRLDEVLGDTNEGAFSNGATTQAIHTATLNSRSVSRKPASFGRICNVILVFVLAGLVLVVLTAIGCSLVLEHSLLAAFGLTMSCAIWLRRPRKSMIAHSKADVLSLIADYSDQLI